MATKKQIAEQAMRILSGGHLKPDRTLDIREVMLALDQLRDKQVQISTLNNVKMGIYSVDEDYISFYESVSVALDATKNIKYITLPASTISLYGGFGLYQITPIGDMEGAYIITQAAHVGLMRESQALEHELNTYCWQVGGKVYFKNIDDAIAEVTVLIAASSKDIADDADYPVAPNDEIELLQKLIQIFSIHQDAPHDEMEDGKK